MYSLGSNRSIEVRAPAKLNLFLEVVAKRPDGFHEIETVMAMIGIYDHLSIKATQSPEIVLHCRTGRLSDEMPPTKDNLVWRALTNLQKRFEVQQGADVILHKRIPAAAGLGGASSDAAAALLAGAEVWGLQPTHEQLSEIAAELGSDIPFFFTAGAAVCSGRGEVMAAEFTPPKLHLVVVRPPVGLSTPRVYQHCRPASDPQCSAEMKTALIGGGTRQVAAKLHNGLEEPASELTPWIERLRSEFADTHCVGSQMSGSGASYFGIYHNARHARRSAAWLRSRGVGEVFMTSTIVQPNVQASRLRRAS